MIEQINLLSLKQKRLLSLIGFLIFTTLVGYDLYLEFQIVSDTGKLNQAQLLEVAIFGLGALSFLYLWSITKIDDSKTQKLNQNKKEMIETKNQIIETKKEIVELRFDRDHWKNQSARFIQEFQDYIYTHFTIWGFTEAEKDIGILLLKGLSLREVAGIRGVSEKTIRNQTLAIYSKSSLEGRHELSAFFLEELLKPIPQNT